MKPANISRQTILYGTAFMLALCFRFILLGQAALTNAEATLAFRALGNPAFTAGGLLANPAYVAFTRVIFFVSESSAFQARFVSALFGSLLVFTPIFFKRWLEDKPAILLAFLLAVEPGLLAVSRQADGITLAIVTILFAMGAFIEHKPILAGIGLGLAILGGTAVIPIILALLLAAFWSGIIGKIKTKEFSSLFNSRNLSALVITAGITLVVVGALAFIQPSLAGGESADLGRLSLLTQISPKSFTVLFLILSAWFIYSPFILFLGLVGIVRGIRSHSNIDIFLSRWLLINFVIVLVNPMGRIQDLAWAVVPLLALAARQIIAMVKFPLEYRATFIAKAIFDFVILGFTWLNLVGIARSLVTGGSDISLRLLATAGAVLMVILVTILVGWGWSWRSSISGLICSLFFLLGIYQLGMARRAAGFGTNPEAEMWLSSPYVQSDGELLKIRHQFSTTRLSISTRFDIKALNLDLPSLQWELKNLLDVEFTNALDPKSNPAFVITGIENTLHLVADYRGEVLNWQLIPNWNEMGWADWVKWIAFQIAPTARQNIILWIRSDIFPE